MGTPVIDVRHIDLVRSGTRILADVSWRVEPGEHWAIVGPNGSGKTSLLKVVTGYLWPSQGTVCVLGNRFGRADLREVRKNIGWTSSALYEQMPSGLKGLAIVLSGEFASFGLYDRPTRSEEERAAALLDEMGCTHVAESPWRVLSLGERQRVLMARALMGEPALLIYDEPCAGLDLPGRERLLTALERLMERAGTTVIYVTHHTEEIMPRVSHVLALQSGAARALGPKGDVLTGPTLSDVYGLSLAVDVQHERYWTRVKKD